MALRILTQNLYNGRGVAGSFAEILRSYEPDVVAVQELSAACAEVLADWGSSHLLDPRDDTTGMGIAARGEAEFERLEFPHRHPVRAVLRGNGWGGAAGWEVINAHLVNPVERPLRHSRRRRAAELAALEAILQQRRRRVLVGDLNSSPAWPLYRRLSALATDAARAAGTAKRTWGPTPESPRALRIDHAFVQEIRPVRTQLVNLLGADHRGLVVDLER